MTFELALTLTQTLLCLTFFQQCLEHLKSRDSLWIAHLVRSICCGLVIAGVLVEPALATLATLSIIYLYRYQGPYNGGSDRMGILALWCVTLAHFLPQQNWKEIAFGYLSVQLVLSYFISGWVKIINPDWRSGQALQDVFLFSAYPVSEDLRKWANRPYVLKTMSWAVMLFELAFPFALATQSSLIAGLVIAGIFHLANACLFGLNRFFWTWLSVYPAILWFQQRLTGA